MSQSKFINPFTDFGFKKIFGEEASKPLLLDFLNALLPAQHQIEDLSFQNPEQLPSNEYDRKAVYDIYCTSQSGERFIVELQKVKQAFFKDRTVYYATFPIQQQAEQGREWNYKLSAVYCIGVLGFTFSETKLEPKRVIHTAKITDQDCQVFYDKLTFIYLEMPNFNLPLEALQTRLDKWLYFIKNLETLQSIPAMFSDVVFTQAFEVAKLANLDNNERFNYDYSLKVLRDIYATQTYAIETALTQGREAGIAEGREVGIAEGREAGIAEGLERGKAEGERQAKLAIAKTLLTNGMTPQQVSDLTGLSLEELGA